MSELKPMHDSITLDVVLDLAQASMFGLSNIGLCISCGCERDGCEPDAREYTCEACGNSTVYGPDELLIMLA